MDKSELNQLKLEALEGIADSIEAFVLRFEELAADILSSQSKTE